MSISFFESMKCKKLDSYINVTEENKMATLREEAKAYEPPQTLNIADLDKIPIDIELQTATGKNNDGKEFTYKFAEIDGKQYRVAGSIIGGIKALLQKIPSLKHVSVIKQGSGMNTKYSVIPYTAPEVPINEVPIKG